MPHYPVRYLLSRGDEIAARTDIIVAADLLDAMAQARRGIGPGEQAAEVVLKDRGWSVRTVTRAGG